MLVGRLGDMSVEAGLARHVSMLFVVIGCQRDEANTGKSGVGAEHLRQLQTVNPRHPEIEDRDVWMELLCHPNGITRVDNRYCMVTEDSE